MATLRQEIKDFITANGGLSKVSHYRVVRNFPTASKAAIQEVRVSMAAAPRKTATKPPPMRGTRPAMKRGKKPLRKAKAMLKQAAQTKPIRAKGKHAPKRPQEEVRKEIRKLLMSQAKREGGIQNVVVGEVRSSHPDLSYYLIRKFALEMLVEQGFNESDLKLRPRGRPSSASVARPQSRRPVASLAPAVASAPPIAEAAALALDDAKVGVEPVSAAVKRMRGRPRGSSEVLALPYRSAIEDQSKIMGGLQHVLVGEIHRARPELTLRTLRKHQENMMEAAGLDKNSIPPSRRGRPRVSRPDTAEPAVQPATAMGSSPPPELPAPRAASKDIIRSLISEQATKVGGIQFVDPIDVYQANLHVPARTFKFHLCEMRAEQGFVPGGYPRESVVPPGKTLDDVVFEVLSRHADQCGGIQFVDPNMVARSEPRLGLGKLKAKLGRMRAEQGYNADGYPVYNGNYRSEAQTLCSRAIATPSPSGANHGGASLLDSNVDPLPHATLPTIPRVLDRDDLDAIANSVPELQGRILRISQTIGGIVYSNVVALRRSLPGHRSSEISQALAEVRSKVEGYFRALQRPDSDSTEQVHNGDALLDSSQFEVAEPAAAPQHQQLEPTSDKDNEVARLRLANGDLRLQKSELKTKSAALRVEVTRLTSQLRIATQERDVANRLYGQLRREYDVLARTLKVPPAQPSGEPSSTNTSMVGETAPVEVTPPVAPFDADGLFAIDSSAPHVPAEVPQSTSLDPIELFELGSNQSNVAVQYIVRPTDISASSIASEPEALISALADQICGAEAPPVIPVPDAFRHWSSWPKG